MMGQNEIENSNVLASTENKRYKLHFDQVISEKIQDFCRIFKVKLNKFIVNSVGCYLYDIEDDIYSKEYDLIGRYFDVSKLVTIKPVDDNHETTEKNITIETDIPPLISKAIKHICDEIPLVQEEFIEDTVSWTIKDVLNKIKEDDYRFLGKYKDFSKISKTIDQIYEEGLV